MTSDEHWARIREHFTYDDGFPRTGGVSGCTMAGGGPPEGDEPKPEQEPQPEGVKTEAEAEDDNDEDEVD